MKNLTTTPTATTETTTATANPFKDAIKAYNENPTDPETLTRLSVAIVYAVTKKIETKTADPTIKALRQELAYEMRKHQTANSNNDPHENANHYGTYIGDSYDLVQVATVALLEETERQQTAEPTEPTDLERPYTIRRLKRKVYIQTADSVNGWEEVETTPIKEAYKAVRRWIDNSRACQTDPRNGYTYIEETTTDPDSENPDNVTIYRRLPKYADLGGHVCDFNGQEIIPTTADETTVRDLDKLIADLKLTDRQKTALTYRFKGYGYKAIATALGIRPDSVRDLFKAIQKKATALGLTAPTK